MSCVIIIITVESTFYGKKKFYLKKGHENSIWIFKTKLAGSTEIPINKPVPILYFLLIFI